MKLRIPQATLVLLSALGLSACATPESSDARERIGRFLLHLNNDSETARWPDGTARVVLGISLSLRSRYAFGVALVPQGDNPHRQRSPRPSSYSVAILAEKRPVFARLLPRGGECPLFLVGHVSAEGDCGEE